MTFTSSSRNRLVSLLAVLTLLAASCGLTSDTGEDVAATVTYADGSTDEISRSELDELYDPLVADEDFVEGAYGGEVPAGLQSQMLTELVVDRVVDDVMVENDVTVSAEQQAVSDERIITAAAGVYTNEPDPVATAEARFETIPYLPFLAELQAKPAALGEALAADVATGDVIEVPCTSHILVETEEEALVLADAGAHYGQGFLFARPSSCPEELGGRVP